MLFAAISVLNSTGPRCDLCDSCDFMLLALVIRGLLPCRTICDTARHSATFDNWGGLLPKVSHRVTPVFLVVRLFQPLLFVALLGYVAQVAQVARYRGSSW